ncbi:hypothetical protein [Chitinophaga sp. 212800010-3]|uniref:hypothetical protein n=1 Tax=unclassified Chitinophaga TaxID=2619133 RepID=UPI002DF6BAC2|nr:Neur-chan-LBD domain-containing protein [Chitinophaga sp. 212800010-3]
MHWNGRHKRRSSVQDHRGESYAWLDRLSAEWKRVIRIACNKVEERFNKIHAVYQKMILVVFFLSGTTMCVLFAAGGGVERKSSLHKVTPITRTTHAIPSFDTAGPLQMIKRGGAFQGIQRYSAFLDSLSTTTKGRQVLDSVRAARPGLFDSLALVDKIIGLH